MLNKQIKFDTEARVSIKNGMDLLANAVKTTLGPQGRCVIIGNWNYGQPHLTKDGVTVAKSIQLKDEFENIGCQLIREASLKSNTLVGDGTTTTVVLSQAFCDQIEEDLSEYKINIPEYKFGIDTAKECVCSSLRKMSSSISDDKDIFKIAYISANNDKFIADNVVKAYKAVGSDGIITTDYSKSIETTVEVISGMQFDRGYLAPHFVTDEAKGQCILDNPYIFISDQKVLRTRDIVPILEPLAKSGQSILLIAEEFDDEVIENLKLNKMQNVLKCCAIKAPSFGDYRKEVLEDIAILTNGTAITYDSGIEVHDATVDLLGKAKKIIVTKDSCTIIGGAGNAENIKERGEILKIQLSEIQMSSDPSDFMVTFLKDRIAKLLGGIAVIHVGGTTELQMKELKDRIDDAICAVRASIEEGVVIGGGMSFYNIMTSAKHLGTNTSFGLGYECVINNLEAVVKQIVTNAEDDYNEIKKQFTSRKKGYNALKRRVTNLKSDGVINPTKCDRIAFENAISIAEMFLTVNCVVADEALTQLVTM